MTPRERREALEKQIQANHDWLDGRPWSGGGTMLTVPQQCQICRLRCIYYSDRQNGIRGHNSYYYRDGEMIGLTAAVECA